MVHFFKVVKPLNTGFYLICFLTVFSSCVNTQKAVYFNGAGSGSHPIEVESYEPTIRPNDLLSITVSSLNPEASEVFNAPNSKEAGSQTTATTTQASGYLVNAEGNIQLQMLGSIKAAGLTKSQLKASLEKILVDKNLLFDPIVDIRYLNFRVTVLGEVAHPTVVTVPSEKISMMEAIGLAGDLTIYARRDNVMLIREEMGVRTVSRINLNSNELLTSPYYFLKPNDIVYVEPGKSKVASTSRTNLWLPVLFSALSFGAIIIDRVGR